MRKVLTWRAWWALAGGAICLVFGVVALFALAGGYKGQPAKGAAQDDPFVMKVISVPGPDELAALKAARPPGPSASIPLASTYAALSQDDENTAIAVVHSDSYLKGLLQGDRYDLQSVQPWMNSRGSETVGAVVTIQMDKPLNVDETQLPAADFVRGNGGYVEVSSPPVSLNDVTEMNAFVDFSKKALVWITTTDGTETLKISQAALLKGDFPGSLVSVENAANGGGG